jgi:beta-glucanase (GH16 family)
MESAGRLEAAGRVLGEGGCLPEREGATGVANAEGWGTVHVRGGEYEGEIRAGVWLLRGALQTAAATGALAGLLADGGRVGKVGDEGRDGTEIDIIEVPWRDGRLTVNLHWDGYGKDHKSAGHKFQIPEVREGWHSFGLLWTEAEYVFYVDGREVWRSSAGGVCRAPLFLKLTEEIGTWAGKIEEAALPDYFEVDYVRVYEAR